jgi:hypothetical protein
MLVRLGAGGLYFPLSTGEFAPKGRVRVARRVYCHAFRRAARSEAIVPG